MREIYIGLMSGTSVDAVDAVAVDFTNEWKVLGSASVKMPEELRSEILSLCLPGENEIEKSQDAANKLSDLYAEAVKKLLEDSKLSSKEIKALGAHGQTVRHRPDKGSTTQIINGSLLAELTGIDTICDFRTRDIAAGGQGAPLVPPFHAAWFGTGNGLSVLNLGGIANITNLTEKDSVSGFDCGPANMLMDAWIEKHKSVKFDKDGEWAKSGSVIPALLDRLASDPYFEKQPPKSTGRELFNMEWLDSKLTSMETPEDVQATLLELTAKAAADALGNWAPKTKQLCVCGGGALNKGLIERMEELLPNVKICSTGEKGMDPMAVEGAAFAWLAYCFNHRVSANCPEVTGARGQRILGCLYPA